MPRYKVITTTGEPVPGSLDLHWMDAQVVQQQQQRRGVKTSVVEDTDWYVIEAAHAAAQAVRSVVAALIAAKGE